MHSDADIAATLSAAFVAGAFEIDGLVARGSTLFGRRWRWLRPLARRVCKAFGGGPRPRQIAVARFLLADRVLLRACEKYDLELKQLVAAPATMSPVTAAASWNVPAIRTAGELADWLGTTLGELDWFADRRSWEAKRNAGRLRHYHYRVLAKRFGSIRLIEAPKPRLKEIQRHILDGILERIPLHDAAHGFRLGRSIRTFAAPHVGRRVVLRIDLADFFPTIRVARIQALFRTIGYPDGVAQLLAGLYSNEPALEREQSGLRSTEGYADELPSTWREQSESRRPCGLPRTSARQSFLCRDDQSGAGPAAARIVRADRVVACCSIRSTAKSYEFLPRFVAAAAGAG